MATPYCYVCEAQTTRLGQPSHARWVGPDGKAYCSMHLTQKFGHGEKLVRVEGYEPPTEVKPPAPREEEEKPKPKNGRRKRKQSETVEA